MDWRKDFKLRIRITTKAMTSDDTLSLLCLTLGFLSFPALVAGILAVWLGQGVAI